MRQCSVKTANVSFESYTISSGASSWCRPAAGRGASRRVMQTEDLLIKAEVPIKSGWR